MHILHISSAISWRGGEQQVAYLLAGLSACDIECTIMAPHGSQLSTYAREQGYSVITYRKLAGVDPLASYRIFKVCQRINPDLIHIHDSHAHTYVYHAYRFMGLKVASVVSRRVIFSVKTIAKYRHPMVRRILAVSQAVGDQLIKQDIDASKIAVVHSGVEVDREVQAIDIRHTLGLDKETVVLICVAALAPYKGHDTLISGFAHAVDQTDKSIHLVLVGGDAGKQLAIRHQIEELGLANSVTLVGYQSDPWSWLAASDIAIFASEKEGLGTSVIDAMALGIPVISTAIDGLATTVIDQQTAIAIPPQDPDAISRAIQHLLSSPQLQSSLVQGARQHVQRFSVRHMVDKTIEVYHSALPIPQ